MALAGFNRAVQFNVSCLAFLHAAERPILPADHEGVDGAFGNIVIHGQEAFLDIPREYAPVARQVADRIAESALRGQLGLGLFHRAFQFGRDRCLAGALTLMVLG